MGISIMRTIVDDLDIQAGADGRGTVVRMSKRLAPADSLLSRSGRQVGETQRVVSRRPAARDRVP